VQSSSITNISPAARAAGCPGFSILVNGSGFVAGATVQWAKPVGSVPSNRTTTFDTTTGNLTVMINTADIATPGNATIDVTLPGTTQGNNLSNLVQFTVTAPTTPCPAATTTSTTANARTAALSSNSLSPAISASRRYVAFVSVSADPATNASTGINKVFLRDTCASAPTDCMPQTILVSAGMGGADPNGESGEPAVSADGRLVTFASEASNLVGDDTNGVADIFVRDTCIGAPAGCTPATLRVSLGSSDGEANGASDSPSISSDGRFVAFGSTARNLVADGSSAPTGAFLRDTCFGAGQDCKPSTTRIPISSTPAR